MNKLFKTRHQASSRSVLGYFAKGKTLVIVKVWPLKVSLTVLEKSYICLNLLSFHILPKN